MDRPGPYPVPSGLTADHQFPYPNAMQSHPHRSDRPRSKRGAGRRAQIGPLGVVLLVAITVIGSIAVVTAGTSALSDSRQQSQLQQVEHSMSQYDARESMVALGGSTVQSISLGDSGDGQYVVQPDAGWISVVHRDYVDGSNETVYNDTLGALVYRNGDTLIGHQGGGVWRRDSGGSVMLSPPEFHYHAETLVLPIVAVDGDDSAAGPVRATVRDLGSTDRIFPENGTDGDPGVGPPYDATGDPYENPIQGGSVLITVKSQFYQGWGHYFETRTEGDVRIDHDRQLATVRLTAPRTLGDFDMPAEGNAVDIRGIPDGHAVDAFVIDLAPDDADAAKFDNLQWSLYAKEGNQEFELHLRLTGPHDDPSTPCKEQDIAATVYYTDTNGNPYHGWHNSQAYRTSCTDRDGDGVEDEIRLVANFTGDTPLELQELSSSDLTHYNPSGASLNTRVEMDEHEASVDWEPVAYTPGDAASIDQLINHYFALLGPDYDLVVDDKNSDTVDESRSTGYLDYEGEGRVTYLHITENRVHIDLHGGGQ